ncbi:PREDICTED: F-box only protein 6-like isoform X1 [Gekko japonicus]|uniref:F-box only protein 6-like isoform X1 n=1 Tax=Gekko japonicus TaxID=146911 RepID=A0ABM1JU22_GEKJA|nr:PREDICTED: F-box only protein 6-like isoform X1 [Gekko japonicus]
MQISLRRDAPSFAPPPREVAPAAPPRRGRSLPRLHLVLQHHRRGFACRASAAGSRAGRRPRSPLEPLGGLVAVRAADHHILKPVSHPPPRAPNGFNFWEIESHEGDKWRIEELPGARRRDFPRHPVPKYFVTSQGPSTKHQLISLKEEGYWDELMDETKPDIVVKDWFHCGCPCRYQLRVKLLSADSRVLQEFRPKDVIVEQCSDREWREVSYTFHNYPAGVRHVLFKHGGQGWYGMRITNSSVTVGPETGE